MSQKLAKSSIPREPENGQAYGVKVLVEGVDPTIDLILVHGLDGHRERTWTADNNVLWPSEYLPSIIPNIRVLSWGYDGRTNGAASSFSCQKLYDLAIALVTDLALQRKQDKTSERPIIFIAHDIGGLILKDVMPPSISRSHGDMFLLITPGRPLGRLALIHSSSTNEKNLEHHSSIKTSTFGILFFGTPHQGSDVLASSRNPLISLKSVNNAISKNISGHSEYLQKQLGQFNHISSHFVTKCFYETYQGPSEKRVAVAISSATVPGAMDVEVFAINSDHGEMVRYKSADDERFKKVSLCLKSMVDDAPEKVLKNWQEWNRIKAARMNGFEITFEIPFEPEYRRNPNFTGRKDLLDTLHKKIGKSPTGLVTVVLHGTGGIGKTQIVSEYAHAHMAEYRSVFWINATTKESIQRGFRTAAQRLVAQHAKVAYDTNPNYALIAKNLDIIGAVDENGGVSSHEDHALCIVRGVQRWLCNRENKQWLLIFDNADDIDSSEIKTYLPKAPHGTVLMTSRRTECCQFGSGLRVEEMQEQEAEDLLLKSALMEENSTARDVTRKLGSLPLAIVQAGAYIAVHQMSFEQYLEIYEQYFNRIAAKKPLEWDYGNRTVWTTWEISYEAIKETDEKAAELLSLCSFFSNENIRDDMLRWGRALEADIVMLGDSLGLLFSYSLAHRKGLYDTFYIHPVVHKWAHERLNDSERVRIAEAALGVVLNALGDSGLHKMYLNYEGKILPHIIFTAKHVRKYLTIGLRQPIVLDKMEIIATILTARGYLQHAEAIQSVVVKQRQCTLGNEHLKTLVSKNNLAMSYTHQGRHKEAVELGVQVMEANQRIQGNEHHSTLGAMNNLALFHTHQGQHKEAMELGLQGMEASQRILGNEHPDTLTVMGNLAESYRHQGRYQEAVELGLQTIEAKQRALGNEHPDTLAAMNNLALSYMLQGRHKEVVELGLQTLEAMQRVYGNEHPHALAVMSNLAECYMHQGRHKEAAELGLQVLEARQRIHGDDHPDTLLVMGNLAEFYKRQGRHEEATELELQALDASQRILGNEHYNTLAAMSNLAGSYKHQGRYKEAVELEQQVVEAMQRILGNEHPDTLTVMGNLAEFYRHQGRYKEAMELGLQTIEAMQRVLGNEHPTTLAVISNLAVFETEQGRHKEGEGSNEVLQNDNPLATVNRLAAALGENHPKTLQFMSSLAESFSKQQRWDEAEHLRLQLVESWQNARGKEHQATTVAKANLAAVYLDQHRHAEAEELILPVIDVMQRTLGRDHDNTLSALKILIFAYHGQGRIAEAIELRNRVENMDEEILQEAITLSLQHGAAEKEASSNDGRKLEKHHPDYLRSMANKAATYWDLEEWKKAEQLEFKVMKSRQVILGKEDPRTLMAMSNLAATYRDQERWKDAEVLEQQVLESRRRVLGNRHSDTLAAMSNLAGTYTAQERWKEAQALYREVVSARTETLGTEDDKTLSAIAALATNHWYQGELKQAEDLELKLLEARRRISGNEDPHTTTAIGNLAATYASQNKFNQAEKLQDEVHKTLTVTQGPKHCETVSAKELLNLYRQESVMQRNEGRLEQGVATGSENLHTTTTVSSLAAAYASPGKLSGSEKLQEEVLATLIPIPKRNHYETVPAKEPLEMRGVMQRSEGAQEQVVVRSFKAIAHKTVTFSLVVSLFFCSFFISFIYAFFTRLAHCFLPTFTLHIHNQEAMVRKWKELADGAEDVTGQSEELGQNKYPRD